MSYSKEKRLKWESMGLCSNCGGVRDNPELKNCAKCRSQSKEKRLKWERMGLCVSCGGLRLDPAWKNCAKCRSAHRDKKLKKVYGDFEVAKNLKEHEIKANHKCWTCAWGKYLGDRFFCPFAEGTCVKEGNV